MRDRKGVDPDGKEGEGGTGRSRWKGDINQDIEGVGGRLFQ